MKETNLIKFKANKYAENFNQDAFGEDLKQLMKRHNVKEIRMNNESKICFEADGCFCMTGCFVTTAAFKNN